ncbi:MAG TPA: beta galactosidase jelly roll domain-containing protein, partial [Niastella sp.]
MKFRKILNYFLVIVSVLCVCSVSAQMSSSPFRGVGGVSSPPLGGRGVSGMMVRGDLLLNSNWHSIANDTNQHAYDGFENTSFKTTAWQQVRVPHNWDAYEGYRRLHHGNRHGYAWYRRTFTVTRKEKSKRYFLWFEGVGSFATVWVNGKKAGEHAGGRTTFTIDVTDLLIDNNKPNLLAVRADHPANINTLPWVCGGCSD